MARLPRNTDSIKKQLRNIIANATNKKLNPTQVKQVGAGREFVFNGNDNASDRITQVQWTRRIMNSGLGNYITPTATYFEDLTANSGYNYISDTYIGSNGNIKVHENSTDPYFAVYSARVNMIASGGVHLFINTRHSFCLTVDDDIRAASSTLGPNLISDVWLTLPSGESEVEIGFYAPSGNLNYEINGDLALQVNRIYAPDKTAPNTPVLTSVEVQQLSNKQLQALLTWSNDDSKENWDLKEYEIWRAEKDTATTPTLSEYEHIQTQNRTIGGYNNTFRDTAIIYGKYYTYALRGADWYRNRSALGSTILVTGIDTTAPDDISNLTASNVNDWGCILSWTWPSDIDLKGVLFYNGSALPGNKLAVVPYDNATTSGRHFLAGLDRGTAYTVVSQTYDYAGNLSPGAISIGFTTSGITIPDTTPPLVPSGLSITTAVESGANPFSYCTLTWDANVEADLRGYYIYRREGADPYDTVGFTSISGNETFVDRPLRAGDQLDYAISAVDNSGNESAMHEYASNPITAGDTTAPDNISDLYVNGVSTSLNSDVTFDTNLLTAVLEWLNPSNTDLDHCEIRVNTTTTMSAATAYSTSELISNVPAEPGAYSTFEYSHYISTTALEMWIFIDPVDNAGNKRGDTTTPAYVRLVFDKDNNRSRTSFTHSPPANDKGWNNETTTLAWTKTADETRSITTYIYTINGGGDTTELDGSLDISAETTVSGSLYSMWLQFSDNTYSEAAYDRVKIDTTAPLVASGVTAVNYINGIKLNWSNGSDALSGLFETKIYRNTSNDSGTAELIATIPASQTSFTDSTVQNYNTYYYWLKHTDNADNVSSFSSVTSIRSVALGVWNNLNWLDNSSFEISGVNTTFEAWTDTGSPVPGVSQPHDGTNSVVLGGSNKVTQSVPLIGNYYGFSFYGWSGAGTKPKFQILLEYKDITGTLLGSGIMETAQVTDTSARYYQDESANDMVIGISGSYAANYYWPSGATWVDVTLQTNGNSGDLDAILMQEIYTLDSGSTWKSIETQESWPTTYYPTRVLNRDRINAFVGRFAELYANNIVAGKVQSIDGNTYFDLDNSEIRLIHSGGSWTTYQSDKISRTLDSGNTYWDYGTFKTFTEQKVLSIQKDHTWDLIIASGTFPKPPFAIVSTEVQYIVNPTPSVTGYRNAQVFPYVSPYNGQAASGWTSIMAVSGGMYSGSVLYNYIVTGYWNFTGLDNLGDNKDLRISILNTAAFVPTGGVFPTS